MILSTVGPSFVSWCGPLRSMMSTWCLTTPSCTGHLSVAIWQMFSTSLDMLNPRRWEKNPLVSAFMTDTVSLFCFSFFIVLVKSFRRTYFSFVWSKQRHAGCLLEGFTQTQISTLAVKHEFLVAGGFQGELFCKVIRMSGIYWPFWC